MAKYVACIVLFAVACSGNSSRTTNPDGGGAVDAGKPTGAACGGLAGAHCEANEFCDYVDNTCGAGDGAGNCKVRPTVCPLGETPDIAGQAVCGCDGKVYSGECTASMAGTDLNADGGCPLEVGRFACGFAECDLASQYCVHNAKATSPDQVYACAALPQACGGTATCGCLSGVSCGTACTGDGAKGLTVTCP